MHAKSPCSAEPAARTWQSYVFLSRHPNASPRKYDFVQKVMLFEQSLSVSVGPRRGKSGGSALIQSPCVVDAVVGQIAGQFGSHAAFGPIDACQAAQKVQSTGLWGGNLRGRVLHRQRNDSVMAVWRQPSGSYFGMKGRWSAGSFASLIIKRTYRAFSVCVRNLFFSFVGWGGHFGRFLRTAPVRPGRCTLGV